MHILLHTHTRTHTSMCAGPGGGQERVSDPLEQELQVTVSRLVVVTELRSPGRVGHFLNH